MGALRSELQHESLEIRKALAFRDERTVQGKEHNEQMGSDADAQKPDEDIVAMDSCLDKDAGQDREDDTMDET